METLSKPSVRAFSLRKRRALVVLLLLVITGLVALLVLNAFRSNLVFFVTPGQLAEKQVSTGEHFRLGGLVTQGSLKRQGVDVMFSVTDLQDSVRVRYQGILPDLFKEGKGVVAVGSLDATGTFIADEVLAKHDENYMPPEAAAALKAAGRQVPAANGATP